MLTLRAESTVHRLLQVILELIRFLDRHRHIAGEINVGRTPSPFCDVRGNRLSGAYDLVRKSSPLSGKGPRERGGFEGKHMGFLPDLEFSEVSHGGEARRGGLSERHHSISHVTLPRSSSSSSNETELPAGALSLSVSLQH